jgi:hypothetical protein
MKIRSGFVSNSSSSSFVVAFDKTPTSQWELLEMLYPPGKDGQRVGVLSPYDFHESIDAGSAASLVWAQLEGQKPLRKHQILEEILTGYFEGHASINFDGEDRDISNEYKKLTGKSIYDDDADPKWKKRHADAQQRQWDDYDKANKEAAKALLEREYPKFKGKKTFRFSFSDNDGSIFSVMEHGDTFGNRPHIRISHH